MNAITQDGEAMDGLEFISELLVRCKVREDVIRRRFREPVQGLQSQSESKNLGELHSAIKARTVQLYSDILQYQIQLAIHYDRGCFLRSLGDIAISNDWKSMTTDLENASDNIHQDLSEDIAILSQTDLTNSKTLHHAFIPADGSITRPPAALFVIDALDECEGDDDLREVLPLFSQLRDLRTIKLRVFMTSRPEKLLRSRFSRMPDAYHRDEDLHKFKPSDIQEDKDDITKLFEHELALMREEILLQDNWPGKERVKKLVLKPMDYSSTLPQLADFSQRQLQKDWQTYD
ncbi:hypothetical protein RJ035_001635 [Blastomyces gilchristii]